MINEPHSNHDGTSELHRAVCSDTSREEGCLTFAELGTVIHTLVIVLVLGAEGCVVVVP